MKILNLYSCLGGNRYKWGNEHDITAVELDSELARMYQERFPNDTWSSSNHETTTKPIYPDLGLYEEVLFLEHYFNGKYVVENVIPYYEPLLNPKKRGRHLYWTNFNLPSNLNDRRFPIGQGENEVEDICKFHEIDLSRYKGPQRKDKIARNLVDYEAGKTILDTAMGIVAQSNSTQTSFIETI